MKQELTQAETIKLQDDYDKAAMDVIKNNLAAIKRDTAEAKSQEGMGNYEAAKEAEADVAEGCKNIESMFSDYINATRKRGL